MQKTEWHMWWKQSGARELREFLMSKWDPIHISDVPEAADEYDSYLGPIASRFREGATVEDIAAYLNEVEEVQMGLGLSPLARERNQALASRLHAWHADAVGGPTASWSSVIAGL